MSSMRDSWWCKALRFVHGDTGLAISEISFPEFFQVLYGNLIGVVVMSVCLLVYLIAYVCGKRMIEIEV